VSPARSHLLLVNPSAGGGRARALLPKVDSALRVRGVDYRLVLTENIEHGRDEARQAVAAGEAVIVMSGDGLIGQVGGELAGTGCPLGVIPGGRGNDFARVVGIPRDVDAAADLLAAGTTRSVDVGEVNGSRFLCIASCGFDSDANRIANEARLVKGKLVYLYAAVRALAAWKPATFTVTADGQSRTFTGFSVATANGKAFGGGMYLAPRARLDDGKLDIVMIGGKSKLRFLRNLPKAFKGKHVELEHVRVIRAPEVTIEADRPFSVYADGDPVAELPAKVRVLQGALEVIAPRTEPEGPRP
jgi:YegS/Rv2252/BmrU family lipid kinase